jgi:hypothetical protein
MGEPIDLKLTQLEWSRGASWSWSDCAACPVQSFHAPAGQPPEPQHHRDVEELLGEESEDMAITPY